MEKPKNYDNTSAGGEFTPISLGGHLLVIKQAEELTASTGNKYLKISFDTDKTDSQPEYYTKAYTTDTRDNKKWSGVATVFPTDREGNTSKSFKGFCTSIEKSNNCEIVWGDKFLEFLKGKKIGGVFGMEEYMGNDGAKKKAHKLFWWRSIENIADADIPSPRLLEEEDPGEPPFMDVPDDFDLPFK